MICYRTHMIAYDNVLNISLYSRAYDDRGLTEQERLDFNRDFLDYIYESLWPTWRDGFELMDPNM